MLSNYSKITFPFLFHFIFFNKFLPNQFSFNWGRLKFLQRLILLIVVLVLLMY